ncbi:hypothetical protein C5C18_07315 [Rathayibacter tritici]|uniref:hypothetical protein n=1 Tax=Rathayibacter tritici TaxID=33888 RepID=UPI000CE77E5B|nr:hypothetical protein [Rathayibacter tritici]PPF29992.1 hypothetical protein C5C06_05825 [Rathayibacter tritici]PPF68689.1 hypothetical protein C5C21_04745 [Rathayibacter tritici]PPG07345.1 hypothetical protein C5C18_07315 [Rathayibacter tritici]PPI11961.1 hypothetical protein C5D07_13280 [Rathayibacter tritici]
MDPFLTAMIAAGAFAGKDLVKVGSRLAERAFGPAADDLGEQLASWVPWRQENAGRIAGKARRKAGAEAGPAEARTAKRVLEEGSYADDELMAEYFSGVLSDSMKVGTDQAVPWAALVADMSASQIALHYVLYRAWAALLHDRDDVDLGQNAYRDKLELKCDLNEMQALLGDEFPWHHALIGLVRLDLIGAPYAIESAPDDGSAPFFLAMLTLPGLELYSVATGNGVEVVRNFSSIGVREGTYAGLRALESARLPNLQ